MRKELDSCSGVKCDKVALRPSGTLLDDNGIFLFRVKLGIYFFKRDSVSPHAVESQGRKMWLLVPDAFLCVFVFLKS